MDDPKDRESQKTQLEVLSEVMAAALGVGTGILTDTAGGVVVGAAAGPVLKATFEKVFGFRSQQVVRMLEFAEQAAGRELEALLRQATADPHRAQLLSAAARAAANTALESKLRVLGRLLVDGLLDEDQANVDEARLLTAAIEDIERLHLRVLERLTKNHSETVSNQQRAAADSASAPGYVNPNAPHAWPFTRLADELGVSHSALELVIGTLSRTGLIVGTADRVGTAPTPEMQWSLTDPGRAVLQLFREAGESAART